MKSSDPQHILLNTQIFAQLFREIESIIIGLQRDFKAKLPKARLTWILEEALGFGVYVKRSAKPDIYLHGQIIGFNDPLEKQTPRLCFEIYRRDPQGDLQFIQSVERYELDDLIWKIYD